jgi:glycosyl transferase family 25
MSSVFSHYDRIQIVNLPHRTDRRREMERELGKLDISVPVSYFPAIKMEDRGPFLRVGSHGAYLSHLAILKSAAALGESVLILQDDCKFLPQARTHEVAESTDIFYGGYDASDPADLHGSNIIGAHFMGFSASAAKKAAVYLESLLDPNFPPEPRAAAQPQFDPAIRPPIDGALVWFRRVHPEIQTEFAMLSTQRSSRTDIGDLSLIDRLPIPAAAVGALRSARADLRTFRVNHGVEIRVILSVVAAAAAVEAFT